MPRLRYATLRERGDLGQSNAAAPPRHATPRHATPRHATPRHATPRHATPNTLGERGDLGTARLGGECDWPELVVSWPRETATAHRLPAATAAYWPMELIADRSERSPPHGRTSAAHSHCAAQNRPTDRAPDQSDGRTRTDGQSARPVRRTEHIDRTEREDRHTRQPKIPIDRTNQKNDGSDKYNHETDQ